MKPQIGLGFSSPVWRLVQIAFALVARDHGTGPARPATQAGTVATQGIRFRARHRDTRGGGGYVPRPVSTGGYAPRDFRPCGPVRLRFRVGSRLVQRPVLTGAGMSDSARKHVDTFFYFFMRACVRVRMRVYVYAISRFAFDSEHAKTPQPYSAGELRSPRISSSRRS